MRSLDFARDDMGLDRNSLGMTWVLTGICGMQKKLLTIFSRKMLKIKILFVYLQPAKM